MATAYKVVQRKYGDSDVTAYELDISHTQGDALEIDYTITRNTGNPTAPATATLVISPEFGAAATISQACTVTDSTTSYNVATTVEGATMDIAAGTYYYEVREVRASSTPKSKLTGRLYIREDV